MAQKQPPYVGGVATVAANGTVVTVTGALDDTNCIEGDHIRDPATGYESRVLERLTVQTFRVPPWRGAALAGAAYELYPDSNLRGGYMSAWANMMASRLTAKGLVWILPPEFASPTAAKWGADPDQQIFSPSLKKWWAMQSGAWVQIPAPYGMMASDALADIVALGKANEARSNLGAAGLVVRNIFTDTTPTSSPTTGAMTIAGGLGVAKSIYAGGSLNTGGSLFSSDGTANLQVGGVSGSGYVAVNNNYPLTFQTNGTTRMIVSAAGAVRMTNYGAGTLQTDASGNITVSSDETLKTIHGAFSAGLDQIKAIRPIKYSWRKESGNEPDGIYAGFSAQNVQKSIPEAVAVNRDGMLSLSDRPIIAALVNAVIQLNSKIEELFDNGRS